MGIDTLKLDGPQRRSVAWVGGPPPADGEAAFLDRGFQVISYYLQRSGATGTLDCGTPSVGIDKVKPLASDGERRASPPPYSYIWAQCSLVCYRKLCYRASTRRRSGL